MDCYINTIGDMQNERNWYENITLVQDKYGQGSSQTLSCLNYLRKDDILQPYKTKDGFKTTCVNADGKTTENFGYNPFVLTNVAKKIFILPNLEKSIQLFPSSSCWNSLI